MHCNDQIWVRKNTLYVCTNLRERTSAPWSEMTIFVSALALTYCLSAVNRASLRHQKVVPRAKVLPQNKEGKA